MNARARINRLIKGDYKPEGKSEPVLAVDHFRELIEKNRIDVEPGVTVASEVLNQWGENQKV